MADLALDWGGDLSLTAGGDLALSEGSQMTEQHIIRRLLTKIRSYIFDNSYGASLPDRIGKPARPQEIAAIVRSQISLESTVAQIPAPTITVTEQNDNPGLFVIFIKYVDSVTGAPVALTFPVQT